MSSFTTIVNNDRLVTATKSDYVQVTTDLRLPFAAAPAMTPGSVCVNTAGTQVLIRKLNGTVGTINIA